MKYLPALLTLALLASCTGTHDGFVGWRNSNVWLMLGSDSTKTWVLASQTINGASQGPDSCHQDNLYVFQAPTMANTPASYWELPGPDSCSQDADTLASLLWNVEIVELPAWQVDTLFLINGEDTTFYRIDLVTGQHLSISTTLQDTLGNPYLLTQDFVVAQ